MYIADRMKKAEAAIFSEMAQRKEKASTSGLTMVDLSIGTPDLPPPACVIEAMKTALDNHTSFYYALKGSQALHIAIADWYENRFAVKLDIEKDIATLLGSQDGLAHLPLTLLNPGDIALVPDPGYPIYKYSVELAGAIVEPLYLLPKNNYLPDFNSIPERIKAKAKLMILNYPSNPLSATADLDFFEEAINFAKKYNIIIIHDLAYSELCFDGYTPPSILQIPGAKEVAVEINSLSKSYNMAGARFGMICGNENVISLLNKLKSNIDYGVFHVVQAGALAALKEGGEHCRQMSKTYQERRDVLVEGFSNLGWEIEKPKASMFLWAKVPEGFTSRMFTFALLEKSGIVVIPGDAFGSLGEGYVRIGLVQPIELLKKGLEQLKNSDLKI